jgi:MOB kinase activator 1
MMKASSLLVLVITHSFKPHISPIYNADVPFPKNFKDIVKQIFKRLFRVYAHIYYSHFHKIVSLGEEAHLNTCFKHFYYFICEFNLVDKKEMQPLQELIDNLTKNDKNPPK